MADPEYERLQNALNTASTPEEKARAAADLKTYWNKRKDVRASLDAKRKGSTPTLVQLALGTNIPPAIPIDQLPQAMIDNPEVYDLVKKVFTTTADQEKTNQ